MFKSLIIASAIVISSAAHATTSFLFPAQWNMIQDSIHTMNLGWAVGDTNNYDVKMGFLTGSMSMTVREINNDEAWMDQNVDLMFQKQKVEVLFDYNTGEVKKMLVNGQEQEVPKSDYEVVEQKEANVTVPAGTFKTMYIKIKDNSQNGQISEQWVNPKLIPINGMAQSMSDSQLGKVVVQLKNFIKK